MHVDALNHPNGPKIGLCIPTYNAEPILGESLPPILASRPFLHRILVIDSSSRDQTQGIINRSGLELKVIPASEFDHGGTRQLAAEILDDCDIIIFMTQDAILESPESIRILVASFDDPRIGASYGRQLPRKEAGAIESHARTFNYPKKSITKSWPEAQSLGIMAGALSNSFAAYRRTTLMEVGGFPRNIVCSEDVYVGFKMLLSGWKLAYVAESTVYHSHDYTPCEELRRYFDIGAFYGSFETWIQRATSRAEARGIRFTLSQIHYVLLHSPVELLRIPISASFKYAGYKLGSMQKRLPRWMKIRLGMNKSFWQNQ